LVWSVCLLRHVRREWALLSFPDVPMFVCLFVRASGLCPPAALADGAASA